jgi:hypothetical protein
MFKYLLAEAVIVEYQAPDVRYSMLIYRQIDSAAPV